MRDVATGMGSPGAEGSGDGSGAATSVISAVSVPCAVAMLGAVSVAANSVPACTTPIFCCAHNCGQPNWRLMILSSREQAHNHILATWQSGFWLIAGVLQATDAHSI